jgi:hypothetical protein
MIRLRHGILDETFAAFRACGGGRRECVAYWLGPCSIDDVVDEVVHPEHFAHSGGYQLDDRWLTKFWFDLAHRGKSVRVQTHTHPGLSGHSRTDDDWAIVHTEGFLSLVFPNFGLGCVGFEGAYLAERARRGWRAVPIAERLAVVP